MSCVYRFSTCTALPVCVSHALTRPGGKRHTGVKYAGSAEYVEQVVSRSLGGCGGTGGRWGVKGLN